MKTKTSFSIILLVVLCLSATVLSLRSRISKRAAKRSHKSAAAKGNPIKPFYRYYNGKDHLYTTSTTEIGTTTEGEVGKLNYKCEGIAGYIYTTQVTGTVPFYRYYGNKDHFYTTSASEIGTTTVGEVGKSNYKCEGIAGYVYSSKVANSVPLYRYYKSGDHFYTTDSSEIGTTTAGEVGAHSYTFEKIAAYILPTPLSTSTDIEYPDVCLKIASGTYTSGYLQYIDYGTFRETCGDSGRWDLIPQGSGKYCIYNRQNNVYLSVGQKFYINLGSVVGSNSCGDLEKWTMASDGYHVTFAANSASKAQGKMCPSWDGNGRSLFIFSNKNTEYEITED